jgi:hypothetical protein
VLQKWRHADTVKRGYSKEIRERIQKFPDWVINKYKLITINTHWEATQRVMAAKLTRLTHKIAIQLHLVVESCTICRYRSRRPVRKLLDAPSYTFVGEDEINWNIILKNDWRKMLEKMCRKLSHEKKWLVSRTCTNYPMQYCWFSQHENLLVFSKSSKRNSRRFPWSFCIFFTPDSPSEITKHNSPCYVCIVYINGWINLLLTFLSIKSYIVLISQWVCHFVSKYYNLCTTKYSWIIF